MRRIILASSILAVASAAALLATAPSCSEPEPTTYGNPNTLDRSNLPGEGGISPLVCTGAEAGTGDGGCPSWKDEIYPYFKDNGVWRCADKTCHGGPADPKFDASAPDTCLKELRAIKVTGIPYIPGPDGGTDPAASSLLGNLRGERGSKMPRPPGADPTDSELCRVEAWLKCGAPDN